MATKKAKTVAKKANPKTTSSQEKLVGQGKKTVIKKKVTKTASKKSAVKKTTTKTKVAKKSNEEVKLRIRVRAYESKILDSSVKQIIDTAFRYEATVRGPVPLPNEIKKYTVNRSSFVHKDAREQFEMRMHKRLIDIINPSQKVVEALSNMNLPSGVEIDVKMV